MSSGSAGLITVPGGEAACDSLRDTDVAAAILAEERSRFEELGTDATRFYGAVQRRVADRARESFDGRRRAEWVATAAM